MSKINLNFKKPTGPKQMSRRKADLMDAYDIGFAKGWDDAYTISKRFGAKTAAAYGYKKGIKHRHKTDKYTTQYKRKGKNY
jgi:hypothetical protein